MKKPTTTIRAVRDVKPDDLSESLHETPFPFVREKAHESWQSGWRIGCDNHDGVFYADALGAQIVEIINVVSPPPESRSKGRVFYLRSWRDPDGREFSRQPNPVMTDTLERVTKLIAGFAHPYTIRKPRPQLRLVEDTAGALVESSN
jgi:hypothetical protein